MMDRLFLEEGQIRWFNRLFFFRCDQPIGVDNVYKHQMLPQCRLCGNSAVTLPFEHDKEVHSRPAEMDVWAQSVAPTRPCSQLSLDSSD